MDWVFLSTWQVAVGTGDRQGHFSLPLLQWHRAIIRVGYGRIGHVSAGESLLSVVGGKPGVYLSSGFTSPIGPHEQCADVAPHSNITHDQDRWASRNENPYETAMKFGADLCDTAMSSQLLLHCCTAGL